MDPHTYALVMFAKDMAISVVPRKKIVESDAIPLLKSRRPVLMRYQLF